MSPNLLEALSQLRHSPCHCAFCKEMGSRQEPAPPDVFSKLIPSTRIFKVAQMLVTTGFQPSSFATSLNDFNALKNMGFAGFQISQDGFEVLWKCFWGLYDIGRIMYEGLRHSVFILKVGKGMIGMLPILELFLMFACHANSKPSRALNRN